ncbi:MAG: TolC family protein [Verrucomicrobiales bacterium]
MKTYILILSASVSMLSAASLFAEVGVVVSLASVGDRVRAQNPDLAAARWKIKEAEGRKKQAGRLPNPELETEFSHNLRFNEGRLGFGLSQRFPVTNRLRLEKERGHVELEAAKAEVREVENQLCGQARQAVVEVLAIRRRKALLSEQIELSKELASFIEESVRRGEGSVIDAGQARLESVRLETEQRQLDAQAARVVGSLKPLLGMRAEEVLHVSGTMPALGELRRPIGGRPLLEMGEMAVTAAEQEMAIEQTKQFGDVEAGLFAAVEREIDEPDGGETDGMVGIRFKLPLPWWDKNEGNIDAAVAKTQRRKMEVEALRRGLRIEADAAQAEMTEWAELDRMIERQLLPLVDEQLEMSERAWREGQGELRDVLLAREKRLDLLAAQLDARRDYHLARVRYETILGAF